MRVEPLELGTRLQPYVPTWDLQRSVHAAVADGDQEDTLLLVEHEPVYTAGRRTARADRPVDGTPVVDVDRGGRITWHGPGQLVGYPIVRLAEPVDVVRYVRALEEALIRACADVDVVAERVEGRSGVWLPADPPGTSPLPRRARKVAAIGVRVARGVTMHGFALNCTASLEPYTRIVPCGIDDADVTTLSAEAGRAVTIAEMTPLVVGHLQDTLAPLLAAGAVTDAVPDPRPAA